MVPVKLPDTRAVERAVVPGDRAVCQYADCLHRDDKNPKGIIKFRARNKDRWVICNVYEGVSKNRRWSHIEHFHAECYVAAGSPFGLVDSGETVLNGRRNR